MKPLRRALLLLCLLIPSLTLAEPEWELLRVNGSSMEPAVHHGDKVCLHRGMTKFHVGDLVAIRLSNSKPPLLKRVVAVAGDRVEVNDKEIRRNGTVIAMRPQSHKQFSALETQLSRYDNIVPANNLIALGDNVDLSFDSSDFGLVDFSQIAGVIDSDNEKCRFDDSSNQ